MRPVCELMFVNYVGLGQSFLNYTDSIPIFYSLYMLHQIQ